MTKYALSVQIECKTADRDAANKLLESLGWGPNNINVQTKGGTWTTTIPCNEQMLEDIGQLADKHPKLDITMTGRKQANPRALEKCNSKAKEKFDKPEFQSAAAGRGKAKVDLTAVAVAVATVDEKKAK